MENNENTMTQNELDKFREKLDFLMGVLPEAQPEYLKKKCAFLYKNETEFYAFIENSIKFKNYPTKKEQEIELNFNQTKQLYLNEFKLNEFLNVIPDPLTHFSDKNHARTTFFQNLNYYEKFYIHEYFKNIFAHLYAKTITAVLKENSFDLVKSFDNLKKIKQQLKRLRLRSSIDVNHKIRTELLQEFAFIEHREEILTYFENKRIEKENAVQIAKDNDLLIDCECCFDNEILPNEIICCNKGHKFCYECVQHGCELMLEQGKKHLSCLANCEEVFSLSHLKQLENIMPANIFKNVCRIYQIEEIKSAELADIEFCPFCDFAYTPLAEDKIFHCINPDCLRESCRSCKEPAHIPFRCNEIETSDTVRLRTFIENKMTDALVRTCYKCNRKFIKEEGCNKMTCECGAKMCYVCKQPVEDYSHFNGEGGTNYHLCPLFSNTNRLHERNVMLEAEKLKQSLHDKRLSKQIDALIPKRKKRCSCGKCHH